MTETRTPGADLARPIFILGILPRSGTAFLSDLLCAHPDCGQPEPIWEDFLLRRADRLIEYVSAVAADWNPKWDPNHQEQARLLVSLGDGLSSFLASHTDAPRVVTKTPRVDNLPLFFDLFPNARLIILVRDGRSVLESGIKSFDWNRESAMHRWAEAADTILAFDESHHQLRDRYLITRYEDLWQDHEPELRRILAFVGLDPDRYDFDAAARLPVRGSSAVREQGVGEMHWNPVEKPAGFDPTQRFKHWGRARHERFAWVAGKQLNRLGYTEPHVARGGPIWMTWNLFLDLGWLAIRILGPLYLRLVRRTPQPRQ